MQVKTKRVSLMKDVNKEEVEKVMKKVDNRNLRRISRMLLEADVKAAEEQEKLKDISMQKVLKSVETRNIRKISKSLQVKMKFGIVVSMSVTDISVGIKPCKVRDAKSDQHGQRACAIFPPSCANFWPVYAQILLSLSFQHR